MLPQVNIINCKDAEYMLFNTQDYISASLRDTGVWDENLLKISRFFIQSVDAPLVIDVGANLGAYSIPLARDMQDKGGSVYGFEPQRIVFYQLCGNLVLNRLENYFAFNYAIGEKDSIIEIPSVNYEANMNVGMFSINQEVRSALEVEQYTDSSRSFSVPMIKLDSLKIPKSPALIKIDVEGYELNVLKGALNFLEEHNYPPLIFEAWGSREWFAAQKTELLRFVEDLGYQISFNMGDEYIAQHSKNSISFVFQSAGNGIFNIFRVR
jgi:FkbM family methyltransferase